MRNELKKMYEEVSKKIETIEEEMEKTSENYLKAIYKRQIDSLVALQDSIENALFECYDDSARYELFGNFDFFGFY